MSEATNKLVILDREPVTGLRQPRDGVDTARYRLPSTHRPNISFGVFVYDAVAVKNDQFICALHDIAPAQ